MVQESGTHYTLDECANVFLFYEWFYASFFGV